jgi:CRP-like cAMP-binding protein
MMLETSERPRFFNAIALTDCVLLQLSRDEFNHVMSSSERKIFNDKIQFLRSLPEFS